MYRLFREEVHWKMSYRLGSGETTFFVEDIVSAVTKVQIKRAQLMFEKDISQLAKPQIKGRGFIGLIT